MSQKVSKKTKIVLVIALALCLISMIGTNRVQAWGGAKFYTYTGTLSKLGDMIDANLAANGKEVDVTFERDAYKEIGFSVLIPKNATAATPAPMIVTCPGDSSSKENQMVNYVELVRRGFVVLSMNYSGNMETDMGINELTNYTSGMSAVVEYGMSLDCVDSSKVGLVGHSYGNGVCCNTVNFMNLETNNHISAWLLEGTVDYAFPYSGWYEEKIMENPDDLFFGIICSQFDEWDNWYDDAVNFLTGDLAREAVQNYYPGFSDDAITEGVWYDESGAHVYDPDSVNGSALEGTNGGIAIWNPAINHNMTITTPYGPQRVVTTMYAAFGVPEGAKYISPSNQVWWLGQMFQFLGVVGFFMLLFPMIDILLCTNLFASLRRKEDVLATEAPSLASWKEIIPLIVTTAALATFACYEFPILWNFGYNEAFDETFNRPLANAAGYFTIWCGIATVVMIIVNYFMRKLFHRGDGTEVRNPFECLRLDGAMQFIKTVAFSLLVVIAMFIPVAIAYYVFHSDFRMNLILDGLKIQIDQPQDYITFFVKYLPMWLIFYIPNAVINANTRFKKIPEWASTIWCVLMNALGILAYEIIQYVTVFTKGYFFWEGDNETWCGLCGVAMIITISYAAFSARYAYRKTNSAWAGAMINACVMGLMMFVSSGAINDLML